MWKYIIRHILRNRLGNLIAIVLITAFMGYKATEVHLSYEMAQMLPESDSTSIEYRNFKNTFGQDGAVMFIGMRDPSIFELENFSRWYDLSEDIRHIEGVEEVLSISRCYNLHRNDSLKKLKLLPVLTGKPSTQAEVDSIKNLINSLPFYEGMLYKKETGATIMMITLDAKRLNTKKRVQIIQNIADRADRFTEESGLDTHYSGLPYIRTKMSKMVQDELLLFVLAALLVASLMLLLFFRSMKAVIFPMLIVIISVIWSMGIIGIFGYKITVLTSIIPPLIIIIGVENCIFLLNKYHYEFRAHGNKVKALSRVVQRVGNATFLTNLTTAIGFAAFIITGNKILVEFGIVASINIMVVFILSLMLIPIFFSYINPPKAKQTKHLESKFTVRIIEKIVYLVSHHRNAIYVFTFILFVLGIIGVTHLKTTGSMVDDLSKKDKIYTDLMFFEQELNGVMPFEIAIDTKKAGGVFADNARTLYKIKKLYKVLRKDTTYNTKFSKPLSIINGLSFAYQGYRGGDAKYYALPSATELKKLQNYAGSSLSGNANAFHSFIDSTGRITRVSIQMANLGTKEIQAVKNALRPEVDKIFPPADYDVQFTGTSVVFLKGNAYMVKNLLQSLVLAIIAIALLMAMLFTSIKMVGISLIPNLLPQLLTAALMGFAVIPIKPSTILIFSVALGISVDNAIHFLSRYRMQLKTSNWNIRESVLSALGETAYSMIYSSIVLFLGFAMFSFSNFGGTQAMGYLVSFTLMVAVLSNLLILPSLLLSLDRRITTKAFKEPLLEIFDEEEDIDLDELEIEPRLTEETKQKEAAPVLEKKEA